MSTTAKGFARGSRLAVFALGLSLGFSSSSAGSAKTPLVESALLGFHVEERRILVELTGQGLPSSFTGAVAYHQDMEDLLAVPFKGVSSGSKRKRTYYSTVPVPGDHGRFLSLEVRHRGESLYVEQGVWFVDGEGTSTLRSFQSDLERSIFGILKGDQGATISLGDREHSFALVGAEQYRIGLTEEQSRDARLMQLNLAGPSSGPRGTVDVKLLEPFLIAVHEVTNAQFVPYVKETSVPVSEMPAAVRSLIENPEEDQLGDLPVTDVNFIHAERYARWLQLQLDGLAPGWRIRVPHEIEWEVAARGLEAASYTFADDAVEKGLESLRQPGAQPVGSNVLDESDFGVRDMTGNVREWTTTIYNEEMLELLAGSIDAGRFEGWAPSRLDALPEVFEPLPADLRRVSHNMTVRGGANGEGDVLFLLSLRRQKELSTKAGDVGFRLVIVPPALPEAGVTF